ncbi:MAG: mechanosensitive ion channel [Ignavibacteriaceae bacterium]|nr:mechanosensitive ion channel [Ignavibacteriaceae bacterium]
MNEIIVELNKFLNYTLFTLNEARFSVWTLLFLFISIFIVIKVSGYGKKLLIERILGKFDLEYGVRVSIATIARYLFVIIGLSIIVQSAGINLSSLVLIGGALGIGIGFGLQTIISEFISGIILMFERPIKVGDRVEVGGIAGNVKEIAPRATSIVTNDNITIIVPNSKFISSEVINWSHSDNTVRLHIKVGVSYSSDPNKIREILLKVAYENEGVIDDPEPAVQFKEFGDSSLNFELLVWTTEYMTKPHVLISQLYFSIWYAFKENGVEIPFPQMDVHLKNGGEDKN